jgi:glycosyltransferase involved in cell wall biosynthesis
MGAGELQNTWIIIAAYNEEQKIAGVVGEVRLAFTNVVVIDDGSRDATGGLAKAAGANVVTHPINLGQGAALQTGIDFALAMGADAIVTFDADGQHQASEIGALLDALRENHAEFALGSRFIGTTVGLPASRRLLLKAATLFVRLTTGLAVTDAHNGLRAMTRKGALALRLRQNRMAHASEILNQIAASGLRYVEVPVTITYTEYSLGKGQSLGDAAAIVLDLFARKLHR